jgi:cyclophilin family peptidyl-prolyl cis-trans isomerase
MKRLIRTVGAIIVLLLLIVVVYYIYDMVRIRTTSERLAEIIHIEDTRQLTSALKEYLGDANPVLREKAALAVGRIGAPGSAGLLYPMLGDSSFDVASTAAFAIGLTSEKDYAGKLLEVAFDLPSVVGAAAVASAGRLADSSMTDVIEQLTQYLSHPSPDVRASVCMALFNSRAKNKAADIIALVKDEPDAEVQKAGLYALARMGIAEALEIYVSFLADPDPYARSLALRGLGKVQTPQAEHYLAIALNDSDPGVVAQAIGELSQRKSSAARRSLVQKLQTETDENLTVALLGALRRQQNDGGMERALSLLPDEPSENITAAVVTYVASIRKDRAVNLIDSLLAVSPSREKAACAEAYRLVGSTNVVPRLATLFNDEDPLVRAAALENVLQVDTGNVDFYLKRALNDQDFTVVVTALDRIKTDLRSDYLPTLRVMMSRHGEIDIDVRRSLVEAAGAFLTASADDTTALRLLIGGTLDEEYIVRRDAARVYKQLFDKDRYDLVAPARTRISKGRIADAIDKYTSNPRAIVITSRGEIEFELLFDVAPLTVLNFIELVESGFYEGLIFHRIVPNFVAQGGDPRGDGWGGPPYFIRCEYSDVPFGRGTVGVATSGKDTGGSQFFITYSPQPHLEARYTVFGQVLAGMEVVDRLVWGDEIEKILIQDDTK